MRRLIVTTVLILCYPMQILGENDEGSSSPLIVGTCADGTRCAGDGADSDCTASCRTDAIYMGSRSDCVYSFDPREPYCRIIKTGETQPSYVAVGYDVCGGDDHGPSGDGDACNDTGDVINGGTLADSSCYYCRGGFSACTDGSACGAGGPGRCDDQAVCADCRKPSCPSGVCGAGGPGLCVDRTPCFRPDVDRLRWRFPTGNNVIASADFGSCSLNAALYVDVTHVDGIPGERSVGLSPQPAANSCVFIGSKDGFFYALDEDAYEDDPGTPPTGACLWRYDTSDTQVHSRPAADPITSSIYVGSTSSSSSTIHKLERYPAWDGQSCNLGDPLTCGLGLEGAVINLSEQLEGDALVPQESTATDGRLVIGSASAMHLIRTRPGFDTVDTLTGSEISVPNLGPFRRGLVQAKTTGILYSGFGGGENDGEGLLAFDIFKSMPCGSPIDEDLQSNGVLDKNSPTTGLPPEICNHSGTGTNFAGIQWHRHQVVFNEAESHFFITNRANSNGDLRKRLAAFEAVGAGETLTGDNLIDCYKSDFTGMVASATYARVECKVATPCCNVGESVDRLFFGDRNQRFYAVDFCEGAPMYNAWGPVSLRTTFRALPVVSLDLETVYIYDESGDNEKVFALDIHDGTIKWEYHILGQNDPFGNGSFCENAATPAGGANCYPAPIPKITDKDSIGTLYPVDDGGCLDADSVTLAVSSYHIDESNLRAFEGNITPGAANLDTNSGVDWRNETSGASGHWPCDPECEGDLTSNPPTGEAAGLVEGCNCIVVTVRDNAGKEGSTLIAINRDSMGCPSSTGCTCP